MRWYLKTVSAIKVWAVQNQYENYAELDVEFKRENCGEHVSEF